MSRSAVFLRPSEEQTFLKRANFELEREFRGTERSG